MNNQQTNMTGRIDDLKRTMFRYEAQLDYPKAIGVLFELLKLGCQDANVICSGAHCSFEMRNYKLAHSLLENALRIEPNHIDSMILKGRILLTHNYLMDALSVFESIATNCHPNESQEHELKEAVAFFFKRNPEVLIDHFPHLFSFMSRDSFPKSVVVQEGRNFGKSLKIGFYVKWAKNSLTAQHGNVVGDELYGEAMCRVLRQMPEIAEAELYAPNYLPKEKLDIMIYLNDNPIIPFWADKHVLYMQNGYSGNSANQLKQFHSLGYDAYVFIAKGLLKLHRKNSRKPGLFLPFGVDTKVFYPRPYDERLKCEVAYVGNDIKGKERTTRFICPALNFDFALYGNWKLQYPNEVWKNEPYQIHLAEKSRGKIPQEYVPVLYSTAQVNINCTLQDCIDWDVITLRTFEVLACKGFLISDGSPAAIKNLSGCVVFTDGGQDMYDKIKYYLQHPEERLSYIEKGYNYVLKNATIEARMKELMRFLLKL